MDNESLMARIQQVEHERDELRKDIEQLCMQQAGPGYLAIATRMHFQRTAALEQEIESLKKKLSTCTRDNHNLQEELSEAYRVKSQLADLHGVEVAKNMEAEKQLKFFQGCVASAFAERDHSIMEAEKAKENEEFMSQMFNEFQNRLEELTSNCRGLEEINSTLRINLTKQEEDNENFKKVVDKFYGIRQDSLEGLDDTNWDDKCACLLHDPPETWSFNDDSTSKYISSLEQGLEKMRRSADNLQNKLRVGLEIENHLKKRVNELEKKIILMDRLVTSKVAGLYQYHSQHQIHVVKLLDEGKSHLNSIIKEIEEKVKHFDGRNMKDSGASQRDQNPEEYDFRDVHISTATKRNITVLPDILDDRMSDASETFAQAMQEKVAALLLLSQQEERHLLERNVNGALQRKTEELQRNLLQVTNEKVKALIELAQLKQEYNLLKEKIGKEMKQGTDREGNKLVLREDGKLRNLLKKTYLKRWIGAVDLGANEAKLHRDYNEENHSGRRSISMDFASMRVENATLKESIECMEHLTSSIHRLRLSLLKAKEGVNSRRTASGTSEALEEIINEAKLIKTALGSSLPISWSAETNIDSSIGEPPGYGSGNILHGEEESSSEKIDPVSAAGFEMVDLLILAAQILKTSTSENDS